MTSPFPFTAHDLVQHVTHDLGCCDALLKVLAEEEDALTKRDSDTVEKLLDQKVPLLEKLENSMNIRKKWVETGQFDGSKESWDLLINKLDQRDLKEKWQTLQMRYQQVREQNEINGRLLSRHQKTVSRVLDLMRGKNLTPNLYNASGQSSNQASSNLFGEA